jgi:hypothetical protein
MKIVDRQKATNVALTRKLFRIPFEIELAKKPPFFISGFNVFCVEERG